MRRLQRASLINTDLHAIDRFSHLHDNNFFFTLSIMGAQVDTPSLGKLQWEFQDKALDDDPLNIVEYQLKVRLLLSPFQPQFKCSSDSLLSSPMPI